MREVTVLFIRGSEHGETAQVTSYFSEGLAIWEDGELMYEPDVIYFNPNFPIYCTIDEFIVNFNSTIKELSELSDREFSRRYEYLVVCSYFTHISIEETAKEIFKSSNIRGKFITVAVKSDPEGLGSEELKKFKEDQLNLYV